MFRTPLFRLFLALAALGWFASRIPAAPDEEVDPDAAVMPTRCHLQLYVDEHGSAMVSLQVFLPRGQTVPSGRFEKVLVEMLGVPTLQRPSKLQPTGKNSLLIHGRVDRLFPPNRGRIEGELDLAPLAALVRPLGVQQIEVLINETRSQHTPGGHRQMVSVYQSVSTADPQPVPFVLGAGRAFYLWRSAALLGMFVVPLVLVFRQRRAALRATPADSAVAWYRFWRWAHWVTLGTWLVWWVAVPALDLDEVVQQLGPGGMSKPIALRWLVTLIPPWLVMVVCSALSHEVFAHLSRAPQPPEAILRRAGWGVLTHLLPLLLAVVGLFSLLDRDFRSGAAWLGAALGVRIVARRLARGGQELTPHAVSSGELRNRIFELASLAGVPLKQLYLVPTGKMPQANAFAVVGGNVLLTDHLLANLTRREVDAIAAHELGHLKFRHHGKLMACFFAVVILSAFAQPLIMERIPDTWLRHLPFAVGLALAGVHFLSRRFEHQTDSWAAWLVGDPEALITGLIKVHRLSLLPMQWGKWEEGLLTHPSTDLRLEVIARENGLSRRRLQEVVEAADQPGDHYAMPATFVDQALVFSPSFKRRNVLLNSRLLLASVLLTPAVVAAAVWWGGQEGAARRAVLAGGAVLTPAVLLILHNYLPVRGYPGLRRRLADKLRAEGIDPTGGTFVAFAPHPGPRLYEGGYTNWDFGFLFLLGDRLCYVGEQTRFALGRDQVTGFGLGPGIARWWRVPQFYVSWADPQRGTSGTFNVRAGEVSSMRELQRATPALGETIRRWSEQADTPAEVPPLLAELPSPAHGEVTSVSPRGLIRPGALVKRSVWIFALGAGLSLVLGLPFDLASGGLAWYVPTVAVLTVWFEKLPRWLYRDSSCRQVEAVR